MSKDRKVVITGIGVVTPVGKDLVSFWDALKNGRSGIDRISSFDPECFDCKAVICDASMDMLPGLRRPL